MYSDVLSARHGLLVLGAPSIGGTNSRVIGGHSKIGKTLLHNQRDGATATPKADNKRRPVTTGKDHLSQPVGVKDLGLFGYKNFIAFRLTQSLWTSKLTYTARCKLVAAAT